MHYGDKTAGAGRILPSGGKGNWAHKRPPKGVKSAFTTFEGATKKDSTRTKHKVSFAPELVATAKLLGMHPLELQKRLVVERKLKQLITK
jgi:hypothetical protein